MENLPIVAKQVLILFLLMGIGFVCRKIRMLDEKSSRGIIDLLILFVTPCVIVDAFQRPFDRAMMTGLGIAFAVAVAVHVVGIALAHGLVRHAEDRTVRVLRIAAVFSNAGFMGIPLEQAILGERGVFFGAAYIVVFNLFIWSWGYGQMKNARAEAGNDRGNDRKGGQKHDLAFLINPGTIGLTAGLAVFLLPWRLPEVFGNPIHQLSGLNTPLAMIVIGYYLAGAKLGAVARMPSAYVSAAIRMVACPLLVTAALYPFRRWLDRDMMLALVIASAAPVAAMVSMFAAKFDRDVDASVGMVSGTTVLSIATVPPVVAFAMSVL